MIQGFIAVSLDSTSFKDSGMNSAATKAKIIGKWIMILGVTLYILRWVVAS
nr:CLC_0170 family protein [Clostridium massiliodielmoense]